MKQLKPYLKLLLLLLIPLVSVIFYAKAETVFPSESFALEKADLAPMDSLYRPLQSIATPFYQSKPKETKAPWVEKAEIAEKQKPVPPVQRVDTSSQRILFFGDSMLEGLSRRMCDYTMENGHELTSVIWYSSSTKLWAETDTLQHFLRMVKPTYVVICLGSNELFVRDLAKRDVYIQKIIKKLGKLPYCWISPPNWKEDTGINDMIIKNVGMDRYFDSRYLTLARGKDKVHPTFTAAEGWMDSVAVWMRSPKCASPILMNKPTVDRKRKYRQILLSPVK